MDSFGYGSANPLRNAVKTVRALVKDRREYLVGIALLLIVVFLWALSNFVTQVRDNLSPPRALLITMLWCRIFSKEDMRNHSCTTAADICRSLFGDYADLPVS